MQILTEKLPRTLDGRRLVSQSSGQYLGVGNNSELHQRTIGKFYTFLLRHNADAVMEVPIMADKKRMPDLVVYDISGTAIIAIEIVDGQGWRTNKEKAHLMVDAGKGLVECFVYECRKKIWYSTTGLAVASYSPTLAVDLAAAV